MNGLLFKTYSLELARLAFARPRSAYESLFFRDQSCMRLARSLQACSTQC